MNTHTPGPEGSGPLGRDAHLVRGLMSVAELMITTDDVDVVYAFLVDECVQRLGVLSAGLLLRPEEGSGSATAVGEAATSLLPLESGWGIGPAVEAAASGVEVDAPLDQARARWPGWGAVAAAHGVTRVTAMPLRLVESPVGALELLLREDQSLTSTDCQVARTFAGLAAVVVHHDTAMRRSSTRVRQLQRALDSRVVVEQAKGFLLAHGCRSPEEAFELMRALARRSGRRVTVVARDVLEGRVDPLRLCG